MLMQIGNKQIEIPNIFLMAFTSLILNGGRTATENVSFLVGRRCLGGYGCDVHVVVVCEFEREYARPCA